MMIAWQFENVFQHLGEYQQQPRFPLALRKNGRVTLRVLIIASYYQYHVPKKIIFVILNTCLIYTFFKLHDNGGVKELTVYYYEHRILLQHAIFSYLNYEHLNPPADYYKPRKVLPRSAWTRDE